MKSQVIDEVTDVPRCTAQLCPGLRPPGSRNCGGGHNSGRHGRAGPGGDHSDVSTFSKHKI